MMELGSLLLSSNFFNSVLLAALLFMLPLVKRPHWGLRLLCGEIFCVLFDVLFSLALLTFVSENQGSMYFFTLLYLVIQLILVTIVFHLCCAVSLSDALFGAMCGYATQHFAFSLSAVLLASNGAASVRVLSPDLLSLHEFPIYLLVYLASWWVFGRQLTENGRYNVNIQFSLFSTLMILVFAMVLSHWASILNVENNSELIIICRLYSMVCCFFALWGQLAQRKRDSLQKEVENEQMLRRQQRDQYELMRSNIEIINRKCHDLKHQIAALRIINNKAQKEETIAAIEDSIMIYDCNMHTGNEVLDTVLTEKSLLCEQEHITWTCIADGSAVSFIDPIDLYTMMGNALDNAIESVSQIQEMEKRVITVSIQKRADMFFLQIDNYYAHPITFTDGLPDSTKEKDGYHGYGMKSILEIVHRYGGTIDVLAENGIFTLYIMIPGDTAF